MSGQRSAGTWRAPDTHWWTVGGVTPNFLANAVWPPVIWMTRHMGVGMSMGLILRQCLQLKQ